jgi:secretion/DNA translocation related TadE-like protein
MVDPLSRYTWGRTGLSAQSCSWSGQRLLKCLRPVRLLLLRMRSLPHVRDLRSSQRERGSATVWAVSVLLLVSGAVGCALIWVAAEGTRHSTERAADSAALAAASAALRRLAMQDNSDPCVAAVKVAGQAGAELVRCACVPLDCTVTVRRGIPFLGHLATGLTGAGTVEATSRAGPVGESAGDGSA